MALTDDEITDKIGFWILETYDIPTEGVTILSARDETFSDGYCETCYYEYEALAVTYKDADGNEQRQISYYDFKDCLSMLLKGEIE